jgi:signal transduction histidine kinase
MPGEGQARVPDHTMGERLMLRIAPIQLDEIELFDLLDVQEGHRVAGDLVAWSSQEYPSLGFSFIIRPGIAERHVWLRLHTTSTRLLHVEAFSLREQHRIEMISEVLTAGYLGLLVFFRRMGLDHLLHGSGEAAGAVRHEADWCGGVFALCSGVRATAAGRLVEFGDHRVALQTLPVAVCPAGHALSDGVSEGTGSTQVDRLDFRVLLLAFPLGFVLLLLDHHRLAMIVNALLVISVILASMLVTSLGRYESYTQNEDSVMLPKRVLLALHGVLLSSMLVVVFPVLGFLRGSIYLLYAPMVHALISGTILVFILQVRAHRKAVVSEKIKSKYTVLKEKFEIEKEFRKEQQNLLVMLAHEIKTPLAVIRVLAKKNTPATAMVGVDQAAAEMSAIGDRFIQAGRSVDTPVTVQKTAFSPVRLLGHIVQSRYGDLRHPVGVAVRRDAEAGADGLRFSFANRPGSGGWLDPDRVFSKYYRSPHALRQSGSGLGLYHLVAAFARQCGGMVRYLPDDEAIRFELWIPF